VNSPRKTGYEERLDQDELFARLGSIFAWQKDLSTQLLASHTTNEQRKQVKVGLEYHGCPVKVMFLPRNRYKTGTL